MFEHALWRLEPPPTAIQRKKLSRSGDLKSTRRGMHRNPRALQRTINTELMVGFETPMLDPAGQFGRKVCFDLLLVARKIGL